KRAAPRRSRFALSHAWVGSRSRDGVGYVPAPGASGDGICQSLAARGIRTGRTARDSHHLPGTRRATARHGLPPNVVRMSAAYARWDESSSRRPLDALVGQCRRSDALSAVEHRPADVVPHPLVVEYERANCLRELVALPPALESPCALALSFQRGSTCGLDRIGGRTELVRGDVCDGRGLAGSVR